MAWLSYRLYEEILRKHYRPSVTKEELAEALIPAGATEDIEPDALAGAYGKYVMSKYRGDDPRPFSDTIMKIYDNPAADGYTVEYFKWHITRKIPRPRIFDLIWDLKRAIRSDWAIAPEQRNALVMLAEPETLNDFLARTFLHIMRGGNVKPPDIYPSTVINSDFPLRNPYFVGHDDKLEDVYDSFFRAESIKPIQAISGMSGVGKSEFAAEYAYRAYHEYDIIWWLTAETEDSILKPIYEFVKRMEPEAYRQMCDTQTLCAVGVVFREWLENNSNWLLIFDNVEDMAVIYPFIPREMKGHILITTQLARPILATIGHIDLKITEIDVFEKDTAASFLLERIKSEDKAGAAALAERLGYLPLALELAAAYILAAPDMSFGKYLQLLTDYSLERLDTDDNAALTMHKRTIRKSFHITIARIRLESSRQLLNLAAYFAPDNIRLSTFVAQAQMALEESGKYLPENLCRDLCDEIKRNQVITELVKYSLVKYENGAMSVHRLVQEVIRDSLSGDTSVIKQCRGFLFSMGVKSSDPARHEKLYANLPHIASIIHHREELLKDEPINCPQFRAYYIKIVMGFLEIPDYERAIAHAVKALGVLDGLKLSKTDRLYYYDTVGRMLGQAYAGNEQYDSALKTYDQLLKGFEKLSDDSMENREEIRVRSARVCCDIAGLYKVISDKKKMIEWYRRGAAHFAPGAVMETQEDIAQVFREIVMNYDGSEERLQILYEATRNIIAAFFGYASSEMCDFMYAASQKAHESEHHVLAVQIYTNLLMIKKLALPADPREIRDIQTQMILIDEGHEMLQDRQREENRLSIMR